MCQNARQASSLINSRIEATPKILSNAKRQHRFLTFPIESYKNHPNNINNNKGNPQQAQEPNNKSTLSLMLKVCHSSTLAEAVKPANDYTSDHTPQPTSQAFVCLD